MLADVVAIIGKKRIIVQETSFIRAEIPHLTCVALHILALVWSCTEPFLLLPLSTGTQDIVFGEVDR